MGWSGGRVNPIDFQSQTQHLTASNIRFVFLSEEVICYFETVCCTFSCLSLKMSISKGNPPPTPWSLFFPLSERFFVEGEMLSVWV